MRCRRLQCVTLLGRAGNQAMETRETAAVASATGHPADSTGRRAQRILSMVGELHKLGLQRLRISPGMSPSGLYWRCAITPADNILQSHGAMIGRFDEATHRVPLMGKRTSTSVGLMRALRRLGHWLNCSSSDFRKSSNVRWARTGCTRAGTYRCSASPRADTCRSPTATRTTRPPSGSEPSVRTEQFHSSVVPMPPPGSAESVET